MKLSQIEKRIPQTLTNSKDVMEKDREHARRSSWARSTRGQENEAWALYKKILSRGSWGDLSRDRYIICPKPPSPGGKILDKSSKRQIIEYTGLKAESQKRGLGSPILQGSKACALNNDNNN